MSNDVSLVEQGDFLLARVAEVKNYGAVLNLIEYEGEKGFVHISEVTSGWIKYIRDFIREGQMVVCKVLKSKAEAKRGMIDLSIRQVSGHKKKAKIRAWKNEQKASKLFEILSDSLGMENADSSDVIINLKNEYSSLYLAFEYAISDEDDFRKNNDGPWVDSLIISAKNKVDQSKIVGDSISEKVKKSKIKKIIYDRNGYRYHGRVKALAEAIREKGVKF